MSITHKADQLLRKLDLGIFVFCVGLAAYIFLDPNHFTNSYIYIAIVLVLWGATEIYWGMDEESRSFERNWTLVGVLIIFYGIFGYLTVSSEIPRLALTLSFVAVGVYRGILKPK